MNLGISKYEIDTPALLIDIKKLEKNINRMAEYFNDKKADVRPHMKTHKTPIISHKQIEAGAIGVTCQKLSEAEVFAKSGINDILLANQIVGKNKINRLVNLAAWTNIKVLVDNKRNIVNLNEAAQEKKVKLGVLPEVNIGMDRCGVQPGQEVLNLVKLIDSKDFLEFKGLEGYEGHTCIIKDYKERERKTKKAVKLLIDTKNLVEKEGFEVEIVTGGSTGTYMITGNNPEITEIEAGSYVTMDKTYSEVEKVDFDHSLTILVTIISKPREGLAIVDAGLKALSSEFGAPIVIEEGIELDDRLSEEHGKLIISDFTEDIKVGDKVELLPSHGCTTINLHDNFYVTRNEKLEAVWPIEARGKFI